MITISTYQEIHKNAIIELILNIQQNEFKVPITREEQPDLETISAFYQQKNGQFWVALNDNKVVGTLALIDIGNGMGAIRKMFVRADKRGKELGVAQLLLDTLLAHCKNSGINALYLGTIEKLKAAICFYEKNGFTLLPKENLPPEFPIMSVDTNFYEYKF
jgi:putative acetyltransferase